MTTNYSYTIHSIIGKTIELIKYDTEEVSLLFTDESFCRFFHKQDCCEDVNFVKEKSGDFMSLVGKTITEISQDEVNSETYDGSQTITTIKINDVNFIWLGTSNGYYDESVSLMCTD